MPIHDFTCGACGHEYEQMLRLSDAEPECPECGESLRQKKKIGFTGFIRTDDPNSPKTQEQLSRYLGNGQYMPK